MALRFGVLGTGYWAQETHASMLAASDDAELVAIWGRDPAKTEAAAGRFGIAGFTDLDRLLAEVDAVAIAVPPDVQAELACAGGRRRVPPAARQAAGPVAGRGRPGGRGGGRPAGSPR